ncbi:Fatty acid synthase [Araneus ventricosus]|uniref:Fatty acid synthase n=1 Tax=Araneus ventricosus TaxID=182803 RepID=A0A4Y2N2L5_ARAVE|nr:Fatty acid synthase [Araneus ventricosus]
MDPSSDHHEYCTGGFDPEDIVISGIAGRFPECDNVGELKEALYSKKDLVVFSPKRFEKGTVNVPYDSCGLINNLEKFDAGFFGLSSLMANNTDPAGRIHMEVMYEAIADAGFDAHELTGQNIGIFNAASNDDAFHFSVEDDGSANSNLYRFVNVARACYSFDFKGPSISIDTACSSSAAALWSAVNNIKAGNVEAAVVSGCQLNLHPGMTSGYIKYGIATPTGNSRPFDASSDGMIRAEAVAAVFLQKAKSARRAYATVSCVRFYSAGLIPEGPTVPPLATVKKLVIDTLKKAKTNLNEIEYVETHGTGTQTGDPVEVKALSEVFKTRSKPLLIGTIKSNLGHTEASSGIK